ncbi:MAG: VOC family protein [Chromatiales bacterium]|jgi:catechol 2,3-dioxygenase-like lactoylglutathione lyase family enzyme
MKIPRVSVITLGVSDLVRSTSFYESVLATPPNTSYEGVSFFELPGVWLSLYPLEKLASDIAAEIAPAGGGFRGVTLAHNAASKEDVIAIIERARSAGARIAKEPQEVFWGGFSAYFADPDEHYWEVVWGPMFEFANTGELRFKGKQ